MIEFFGSPDEFFAMLGRVKAKAEQDEREFWAEHPDGITIEFSDGETRDLKGPDNADRSGDQPGTS